MRQGFAPISLKMQHLHTVMENYHVKRIGFPYYFPNFAITEREE